MGNRHHKSGVKGYLDTKVRVTPCFKTLHETDKKYRTVRFSVDGQRYLYVTTRDGNIPSPATYYVEFTYMCTGPLDDKVITLWGVKLEYFRSAK